VIANNYTVGYAVLSGVSGAAGLGAAAVAYPLARRWRADNSPERRQMLEKWVMLVVTLVTFVLWVRLAMIPLWFWTLESLVPSIPGAMCLTGVHLARAPVSYFATAFKFLLPAIYGYWLAMDAIDRGIKTQPLTKAKLMWLLPIGLLLLAEAVADEGYLLPLKPRVVSCCTSVFDAPKSVIGQGLTEPTWVFVGGFFTVAGATLLALRVRRMASLLYVLSPALVVAFVLALHTRLSPLFLHAPFHHCIFCVWHNLWDAWPFTSLVLAAAWLAPVYASVWRLRGRSDPRLAESQAARLCAAACGALIAGLLIVGLHLAVALRQH
jgi:hypothetical protein